MVHCSHIFSVTLIVLPISVFLSTPYFHYLVNNQYHQAVHHVPVLSFLSTGHILQLQRHLNVFCRWLDSVLFWKTEVWRLNRNVENTDSWCTPVLLLSFQRHTSSVSDCHLRMIQTDVETITYMLSTGSISQGCEYWKVVIDSKLQEKRQTFPLQLTKF